MAKRNNAPLWIRLRRRKTNSFAIAEGLPPSPGASAGQAGGIERTHCRRSSDETSKCVCSKFEMNERGFTLIELLVSISIVGLLASTSITSYAVIRQSVYDSVSKKMIHDITTAIETTRADFQESSNDWFWLQARKDGTVTASHNGTNVSSDSALPGMRFTRNTQTFVWVDGWCSPENIGSWCPAGQPCCVTDSIRVNHCQGKKVFSRMRWNNGDVTEMQWDNWGCW